jgi:hypothetical protein
MWIELSELGIALVTAVLGGGRLLGQFRSINTVKELRDSLNRITGKKAFSSQAQEAEVVVDFLNYSQLIAGPLRSKLIRRLLLMLGLILASGSISVLVVDQGVVTNAVAAWAIRIGVAVFQVGSGILSGKFFQPEELEFLKNSASLQERFYDLYVLPAIYVFNNGVRTSEVLGPARDAGEAARLKIPKFLDDIFKSSLELQKKQDTAVGQASADK